MYVGQHYMFSYILYCWHMGTGLKFAITCVLDREFLFNSVKFILNLEKKHCHVMSAGLVQLQWLSIVFMVG